MKTELKEQSEVVRWCRDQGILISAIAQSTWTSSWKEINKNKMAGVVRGVPDLVLSIPSKYRKNAQNKLVWVEMKRIKGGVISKEQKIWIKALNNSEGVNAQVCHGAEKAIEYIKSFMELEPPKPIADKNFINNL